MRRLPPVAIVDVVAVVGLVVLAWGVALLVEPAAALVVVGLALLLYAIAASRVS
jgi:hypothetical protein